MKKYLLLALIVSAFCSTNSQAETAQTLSNLALHGYFTPSPSFCASTNLTMQKYAVDYCIINAGGTTGCSQYVAAQCAKLGFPIDPSTLL